MKRLLVLLVLLAALVPVRAQEAAGDEPLEESGQRLSVAEAQRIFALPAPVASADKTAQVEYWVNRQRAAFTLGRSEARLEALRRLVELTQEPGKPNVYLGYLWREEVRFGNQSRALEIGEALVADANRSAAVRIGHMGDLGVDYIGHGEIANARRLLQRADEELRTLPAGSTEETALNYATVAVERLRSRVLLWDGDSEGALAAVKRALEVSRLEVERARKDSGNRRGDLLYDRAIRMRNGAMSNAIQVYFNQGRNVEAEALARQGLQLVEEERTGGGTLGIWHGRLAFALLGQRRFGDAQAAARTGIAELAASGAVPSAEPIQLTQFTLLQSLLGQKRWADANALYQDMRTASADDALARSRTESASLQAFLLMKMGQHDIARDRIEGSVRYRQRFYGEEHFLTVEGRAVRAMVLHARGDTREALSDFEALFKSMFAPENAYADAQPKGLRGFYVPQALETYLALVAETYRKNGTVDVEMADRAFRVADRIQASAVQQALVDGASRVRAGTPELAELARKEQEQRIKMRDLVARINSQLEEEGKLAKANMERIVAAAKAAGKRDEAGAAAERERARLAGLEIRKTRLAIGELDKQRAETQVEVARRFPAYYALVNPKPPTLADIGKALGKDEAFVSLLPWDGGTYVWAVAPGGASAFHVASAGRAEIAAQVEKLRATLDIGAKLGEGVRFDVAASHRLFTQLLGPVWPKLGKPRVVTFAGSSELGRIPFATLVTETPTGDPAQTQWLVRSVAVNQVATAAAFKALRDAKARTRARSSFFGFGDPAFSDPSLVALPETRDEIVAIAKALGADPARDTRFGKDATRKAALEAPLADRRVVAFATHGLKPGDLPGLSRPALAMAGSDPLLVLDDVLTLKLGADWVVLSACNTASSDGRAQEAFSGLARGFFFAGARSVLATHWAVETLSAQQLVTRTFAHQAANPRATRAESLRQAQLELIEGKADARFRHPFYWAPYALYGDPEL